MANFVSGLELGERFYLEAAKTILEKQFPHLRYSAAMLGWSSEVLGYDDVESTDHNWGPRFQLFLSEADFEIFKPLVSESLSSNLPTEFYGYSTNFGVSSGGDQLAMEKIETGAVRHKIDILTVEWWLDRSFGSVLQEEIKAADWLAFSEQKLLAFTSGKVFHDGLGTLEAARRKIDYYPPNIWLYLLACQWKKIADEEAFVGRAGFVGDELGSAIIAARIVKYLMQLCFLMEREYAPYSKWFGTAFTRLKCSSELSPIFRKVLAADDWKEREMHLARSYEIIARLHNELQITEPIAEKVSRYYGRPYPVIHANRFDEAIRRAITDEEIRHMEFFAGSVNQLVESDDEISDVRLCKKLKILYE